MFFSMIKNIWSYSRHYFVQQNRQKHWSISPVTRSSKQCVCEFGENGLYSKWQYFIGIHYLLVNDSWYKCALLCDKVIVESKFRSRQLQLCGSKRRQRNNVFKPTVLMRESKCIPNMLFSSAIKPSDGTIHSNRLRETEMTPTNGHGKFVENVGK